MPNPLTGDPKSHDVSEFKDSITGHCLCGSITVTIRDPTLFDGRHGHICHCANCRKVSGSFAAPNLAIEKDKVTIEDKNRTLKVYEDYETMSGNVVRRAFCSNCGSPVRSETPMYDGQGKLVIKMGMFPRIPTPEFETFADHRHPWQGKHEGVTQFKIARGGPTL
ncbi:hypothetical protein NA57DRAFT_56059 [Rhizodiscina lignyota]|uniref:CENP-V/GFA domain-containing protein n=1 Tax=Rhizodiscina lignyota TaxID=1504668 RepID=A0A9P4IE34_9PEZI|nr:hypothetical protein NA57DRAFT_56059 [Rhizodiscina lignyota]